MKKVWVVGVIAGLHVVVIGSLMLMQGCQSSTPAAVQPASTTVMPPSVEQPKPTPVEPQPVEQPPAPKPEPKIYVVDKGDSLAYIGKRFNVSVKDIIALNSIKNPDKLKVGQKLTLPEYVNLNAPKPVRKVVHKKPAAPVPAGVATGGDYEVKKGDTLEKIAKAHGTTIKALTEANNLASDRLQIGQKLALPKAASGGGSGAADVAPAEAPEAAPVPIVPTAPDTGASGMHTHKVLDGETLDNLAFIYNVTPDEIVRVNNLTNREVRSGQYLKIPPAAE